MGRFQAFNATKSLCQMDTNHELITQLRHFLTLKSWSPDNRQHILDIVSDLILIREVRPKLVSLFAAVLNDLLFRCLKKTQLRRDLFVAVSELIGYYSYATHFAYQCFQTSLFNPIVLLDNTTEDNEVLDIIIACLSYVHFNPVWFRDAFDWSFILQLTSHANQDIRYISIQCYVILFGLNGTQFDELFAKEFTEEDLIQLRLKYLYLFSMRMPLTQLKDVLYYEISNDKFCGDFEHYFDEKDFTDDVVCVEGILINKLKSCQLIDGNSDSYDNFNDNNVILLSTTRNNIRNIALGIAYEKPILIEGPVGSGKTLLIEYIASLTGRRKAPQLTKIQMGDQIDAKMLIGSYICTDIPGEFVWKAGPLTQAMKYGHWIVLEDIDCAPSDVISMLTSVLESNSLSSLPGCENQLNRVHNEFCIFFTRRLISSQNSDIKHSEFAIKFGVHNSVNKLCFKVTLNLMDRTELSSLISKKWSNLDKIIDRILDIYYYLQTESQNNSLKRQISLRDLMKWCQRISKNFKLNSDKSAITALLDANDCFLQSHSSPSIRITKSQVIGSHLNITESQSEYLCAKRKPELIVNKNMFKIGRIDFKLNYNKINLNEDYKHLPTFALTHQSLSLLERISVAIDNREPVLLCGETGTGKTSCVQYLAKRLNKSLTVINMNQQSDSSDLLGGYKPIELNVMISPIKDEYLYLFENTFEKEKNLTFLTKFERLYKSEEWSTLFKIILRVYENALTKCKDQSLLERWKVLGERITRLQTNRCKQKGCLAFSFIEGSLVKAMKNGDWILLDEINLAESETLQCLSAILDTEKGSVVLLDKADGIAAQRNPEFRLFACMNPATDVGKKELPLGIRNRFTEFFVDELEDKPDLRILIHSYIGKYVSPNLIETILNFYLQMKSDSKTILTDSNGLRPHYSLRTLCRALSVSASNPCTIVLRSLYEAICLSFLTRLDHNSHIKVENDIKLALFGAKDTQKILKAKIQAPKLSEKYQCIEGFYILKGPKELKMNDSYILTETVKRNLQMICRIVSIGKTFPILLEGETSVGKTSLIEWLAAVTGNVCVRVNNHEHTDLQEYVGSYCVDANGKLVFREGVLAEAMRNGYWIILDELNLAPTDVLEALNRVLDDNRELFIPETQQLIKANSRFLLFATQNPAGHYGGRKVLSRAFRNRFVELHFNEIPNEELEIILHKRCALPMSYAKRMVGVLHDLQIRRRESGVFAGKQGFITLRDLFRWGERYRRFANELNKEITFYDYDLHLVKDGYMLLAGRVRKPEELSLVQSVLETRFKRKLDTNTLFNSTSFLGDYNIDDEYKHIVWTKSFKRLAILLSEAIKYNEPVLLVGETGCGKTSICQLFAGLSNRKLHSVSCHMNTESADFLGSLRPVREHIDEDSEENSKLFEWVDGPLVDAMKNGDYFMVDEISLADDSVLERLNSVLETERTLVLAENNNTFDSDISIPVIKAKPSFRYMATMNPGGDYGKKELSPALRNRFTEIWCPSYDNIEDIKDIIDHNLSDTLDEFKNIVCQSICQFISWFNINIKNSKQLILSIRDVLSWVEFINVSIQSSNVISLSISDAFMNGALLVFVDAIGCAGYTFNTNIKSSIEIRTECQQYLNNLCQNIIVNQTTTDKMDINLDNSKYFTIKPFCIHKGPHIHTIIDNQYYWDSPTVRNNALSVLRAMQLPKPILLEGMPGVGKTTLVQALAKASGHRLIRINLSEQTDISDLFGADLPIEGDNSAGKFAFRDGPLLQALKSDWTWIVLDELNLAQQSVLEGLNACFDHRNEIFIPELNKTFKISKTMTRIFATQNPHSEGGARKGLPRSLLNRFTNVYMHNLDTDDYVLILTNTFPKVPITVIKQMVSFNDEVINEIVKSNKFGQKGSPWEFNLRELIRWLQLTTHKVSDFNYVEPENFVKLLYIDKMRTIEDKIKMSEIVEKHFNNFKLKTINFVVTDNYLQIGHSFIKRRRNLNNELTNFIVFDSQKQYLESLMKCLEMNWMSILIGDSGVGKTSVVKLLADLTGHKLRIFSMNPEMDTMDLLGGFEQKDFSHQLKDIEESIYSIFCQTFYNNSPQKQKTKQILELWFKLQTLHLSDLSINDMLLEKLQIFDEILDIIKEMNVLDNTITTNLKQQVISIKTSSYNDSISGTFEWRDSIVVRAVTSGGWLLIDNANLCSASVLDRLNSLLEPNGELIITEKGSIDGQLTTIKPHPDFRLILTMDSLNGELSRAMRNRGIEIFMFPINDKQDFIKQLNGLFESDSDLYQIVVKCYEQFNNNENDKISLFSLTECVKSLIYNLQNGFRPELCLKEFCLKISKHCVCVDDIELFVNNIMSINITNNLRRKTLSLNNYKYDSLTSYAVDDLVVVSDISKLRRQSIDRNYLIEKFSTTLRIYLEKSCFKDFNIRCHLLNQYSSDYYYTNDTQLMSTIGSKIEELIPKTNIFNNFSEIEIDLRHNTDVWKYLSHLMNFSDCIELIENNINRFMINMFCHQLKCQQMFIKTTNGDQMMTFMQMVSQLINDKSFRSPHSKLFIAIYSVINNIENQLITKARELCPTNDDFILLRDILLWINQLLTICYQKYPKADVLSKFVSQEFITLWILCNDKSLSILQTFLDIDLGDTISNVNNLLNIDGMESMKTKYNLSLLMNNNCFIMRSQDSAIYFESFVGLCDDIFRIKHLCHLNSCKDIILLMYHSICDLISDTYNRVNVKKDLKIIKQMITNLSKDKKEDEEESFEYKDAINRRKSVTNKQLEPLYLLSIFYAEMIYFNKILNNFSDQYLKLFESKFVTLNPFHMTCLTLSNKSDNISTDLILYHFIDLNQNLTISNVLNLFSIDLTNKTIKSFETNIFNERLLQLTSECLPFISLTSSYLLSNKHNSIGLLSEKLYQYQRLKQFLTLNFETINEFQTKSLTKQHFIFIKTWFSQLIQNVNTSSPVKKNSLSAKINDTNELFNYISLLIYECKDSFDESVAMIYIGYTTTQLLCPTYPIDPIVRINCKLNHYIIDLKLINAEIEVRNAFLLIKSSHTSIDSSDHILMQQLIERKKLLEKKIAKFESSLPFRSTSCDYQKLKADCIQFIDTVINKKALDNCLKKSITVFRESNGNKSVINIQQMMDELMNLQLTITSFIRRIQISYPLYQDLVNVFLIGVSFIQKGLKDLTFYFQNKNLVINELKFSQMTDFKTCIQIVGNFCNTKSPAFIAKYLCSVDNINNFKRLLSFAKLDFDSNISKLLISALIEIQNEMSINYNNSHILLSLRIFDIFVKCWQKMKEEEEIKKSEEETLFEYRMKTECTEEMVEEERDKQEIEILFPTYYEQYVDVIDQYDSNEDIKVDLNEYKTDKDITCDIIRSHLNIVELYNTSDKKVINFREPYIIRHSVVSQIIKRLGVFFDISVDSELIGGHLIACNEIINDINSVDFIDSFNIYHNSSIQETSVCLKILETMETKIMIELLPQFENHPILLKILKVIHRIFEFNSREPLIKFATGLEVLLEVSQDWQLMAHKGISLTDNLNEVTQLLISWRKLELKCWSECLNSVDIDIEKKLMINFWFHLYITITSLLESNKNDFYENEIKEFIASIQKFIENSKLGEFKIRLNLLRAFIYHIQSVNKKSFDNYLFISLKNLYEFYRQFNTNIENALINVRKPIEKEVKEFVKITKWSDNNFWSLKSTVDKSHKQLYKYIKKYRSQLIQPIHQFLVIQNTDSVNESSNWKLVLNYKNTFDIHNTIEDKNLQMFCDYNLLQKSPSLLIKSKRLSKKIFKNTSNIVKKINCIEEFSSDIINTVKELSCLQVTEDIKDKTKWKKSVNHIQNRKRRALSELFKSLTHFGLSYRKGLVIESNIDLNEMIMTTNCLNNNIHQSFQLSIDMINDITSCDKYFYKSLARFTTLRVSLESPNKQLSIGSIDRIKGFSAQLMNQIIDTRNSLSKFINVFKSFKLYQQNLNVFTGDNALTQIISKSEINGFINSAENIIIKIIAYIYRSIDLINSLSVVTEEPVLLLSSQHRFHISDQNVNELNYSLNFYISKFNEIISKFKSLEINGKNGLNSLKDLYDLKEIYNTLMTLMDELKTCYSNEIFCYLSLDLKFETLFNETNELILNFESKSQNYLSTNFEAKVDNICAEQSIVYIKTILLSIEKIFKSFNELKDETNEDLLENSFQSFDLKNISKSLKIVNNLKLFEKLIDLMNTVCQPIEDSLSLMSFLEFRTQILKTIYPFLEIYTNLLQYFVILSISSLRTSNKLLYVLLSLFCELIQNGFCLPQELNEESESNEKGTEFKNIENAGLGEGEGTKDVSDKIESEDQLEDTFKEGLEKGNKDEEEDNDIEEEDNGLEMENDFEGQMFSPSKGDKEDDDNDSEGSNEDENLENQMDDVDDNSEVLDEKIWGSDEEDLDSDQQEDDDETGFAGKDSIDSKVVSKDENKDLKKENEINENERENDEDLDINENELQNDEYEDETIDPYKEVEPKVDKSQQDLPENMQLDDNDEENDKNSEQNDEISVSNESFNDSESNEQDLDDLNEEDFNNIEENETNDNNCNDKTDEIDDKESEDNETKESEDKQSISNPNKEERNTNNEIFGLDNNDKSLENDMNSKQESDICNEQNSDQTDTHNVIENDKQHGLSQSLVGDNSTQSQSQQIQTSDSFEDKESNEEKFQQNNKMDKTRRTLTDDYNKSAKRQKVLENNSQFDEIEEINCQKNESENQMINSQLYQHIDDKTKANNQVMDIASNEEKIIQKEDIENDGKEDNKQIDVNKPEEMDIEETEVEMIDKLKPIDVKPEVTNNKLNDKNKDKNSNTSEEIMDTDGQVVPTLTVQRGNESTFCTPMNVMITEELNEILIENCFHELSFKGTNNLDINTVIDMWKECEAKVSPLVYELCDRLQLVLEPTKMAKLRGDYRTGKRLNMRKVIAYIASDFRKDKIWLRRTKASKREFQIVIAIDDSSSMSDNKSKQMAFESLALLGKSLTLLEAGELAIVSFGQTVNLLHHFNQTFNENTGVNLLTQLTFEQKETRIGDLLEAVIQLMSNSRNRMSSAKVDISQLLVIVSDGRGIYSEGEQRVKQVIRRMKELGVFVVFVVIDNPLNKDSILDIRVPIFSTTGSVKIESYMERFPFPFYILLRDINGLPIVMGEALRQWFELITSGQT